jgi:hypothetical protein
MVMAPLEIEHIISVSKSGSDDEHNLLLACPFCNEYKCNKIEAVDPENNETVPLFNPRKQVWLEHFQWAEDFSQIVGITAIGRATVAALRLNNNPRAVNARKSFVRAGWNPIQELEAEPPLLDSETQ